MGESIGDRRRREEFARDLVEPPRQALQCYRDEPGDPLVLFDVEDGRIISAIISASYAATLWPALFEAAACEARIESSRQIGKSLRPPCTSDLPGTCGVVQDELELLAERGTILNDLGSYEPIGQAMRSMARYLAWLLRRAREKAEGRG